MTAAAPSSRPGTSIRSPHRAVAGLHGNRRGDEAALSEEAGDARKRLRIGERGDAKAVHSGGRALCPGGDDFLGHFVGDDGGRASFLRGAVE